MIKLRTMEEFIDLDVSRQVDLIVKLYVTKCTKERLFVNKKMNPKYFQLRNYFLKQDSLPLLYQYLKDLPSKRELTINELFRNAKFHQSYIRVEKDKDKLQSLKKYDDFSLDML